MLIVLWIFILVAAVVLFCVLEQAERCTHCGSWFRFHPHRLGFMCSQCGHVKEMK